MTGLQPVLSKISTFIARRVTAADFSHRPYLLGITGKDASGKTQLAQQLYQQLQSTGITTHLIHVDDFHRPRAERYHGQRPESEKYRYQSIDFEQLRTEVLLPLRHTGQLRRRLQLLDIPTDEYTLTRNYDIAAHDIVLVEGVFLLGEELRELFDDLICLTVSEAELLRRGVSRDADLLGDDATRRFQEKYLPAQRQLFEQFPPEQYATILIDNEDYCHPRVVSQI